MSVLLWISSFSIDTEMCLMNTIFALSLVFNIAYSNLLANPDLVTLLESETGNESGVALEEEFSSVVFMPIVSYFDPLP